ncbi:N-alpha-acetyltransferase 40 isoform X2 [Anthonomus grandis grandis]|uniref:N-alpha-acetyltransferase 40 isoform X2 n=1 Tax=Anthonomus grandis grandis TaxID=2921223 RepID=UPI002165F196|nr:N-alpha-acetyltransferase 40 isoform X2 [Anthonomus grandis grandis]
MGRKTAASSAKGKEKRQQRKEEQQRIRDAMAVVAEANKLENPLKDFQVFQKFNKNGIVADIFFMKCADLSDIEKQWVLGLTKKNMQSKYEHSSWGWDEMKKSEELFDENAKYLIAKSATDGSYLGFSHFRFDIDEGIEVLYCYELQLENHIQRKSLGKFMMQVLELMAFKNNMKKVVLTVLKNNNNSKFFKAVGYELDESSPVDDEEEVYPYEILSKINKRLASTLPTSTQSKSHIHSHNGHSHGHSHLNGPCCPGYHH